MALVGRWPAAALLLLSLVLLAPQQASGNWMLQCSSCVDQALFSDEQVKENIKDADVQVLLAQVKQIRLREFDHREDEFYNKFFSKRQLGLVAQELQPIMPGAVALLPERRWTNAKGVTNQTKNVMLLRDSHLLMVAMGLLKHLAQKAEYWDSTLEKLQADVTAIVAEQQDNRRKREEMLEQIVRTIAKVEVLQHALVSTEEGFARLTADVGHFKTKQDERYGSLQQGLELAHNRTSKQDEEIKRFQDEFRQAVDREARADLVEKRKTAEADLEVTLVKRSIEQLRWEEEQKTINLRAAEQRKSDDHSSKLHQERVEKELAMKKQVDLELLQSQEESNIRQEQARQSGEKELLMLRLQSDERRAEMGVQEAIERAKVEEEAKIRGARENEDVNMRAMRAEMSEKRAQLLAAISASADIVTSWVKSVYGSPQNLVLAIGSFVVAIGGVYLAREMAILLREQLNKRLGRPSLVRTTNRRGLMQEFGIGLLRLLRLRKPSGSEFDDVVLHPKLRQQVMRLADATRSAKRRRMPLQHAMFYGPPGTGKTMVAQRFAEYSGLEYAIMSGGDVAPLQEQGVTELHKLFKWVHRSRRGVLLFIDEADAFLASRKNGNMSETLRNALTTILYHTGTPTSQFMMVIATNRPGDLDSAVLDRIDESVEFGLPDLEARKGMVRLYYDAYIARPLAVKLMTPSDREVAKAQAKAQAARALAPPAPARSRFGRKSNGLTVLTEAELEECVDEPALDDVANRLHGFSGREIAKLFTSFQTHVLYRTKGTETVHRIEKSMLFEVVDQKVSEHERTADFQVSGYNYQHGEKKLGASGHTTPTAVLLSEVVGQIMAEKMSRTESPCNGSKRLTPPPSPAGGTLANRLQGQDESAKLLRPAGRRPPTNGVHAPAPSPVPHGAAPEVAEPAEAQAGAPSDAAARVS